MDLFKQKVNEKPESRVSKAATTEDTIVYQFNYKPEQFKLQQTARVADLESRLHKLESVLGATPDKLSRLTTATNTGGFVSFYLVVTKSFVGSLLEATQYLSATASLLNSSQLDHVEGRLAALAQKLDAIGLKKKELQQDEEKDKMVRRRLWSVVRCFV